jgi:hypothetical protein
MSKKKAQNRQKRSLIYLLGIIVSVFLIWVFIFSIWYSGSINNRTKFVNKTTKVLETETVRTAISNEIIEIVKEKRPLVGTLTAPVLSNIITGVLDTNLFDTIYKRIAGELHLQLTTKNPRPLQIDVKQTKEFIEPLVSSQDDTILNDFPDQIVLIKKGQFPSLYLFGAYLGIIGPAALITALVILGYIWLRTTNKRNYLLKLFLVIAAYGVLVYFLIPTLGTYLISKFQSVNLSIIVNEVYNAFTDPLAKASMASIIVGLAGAISSKWLNRDILRIPRRKRH